MEKIGADFFAQITSPANLRANRAGGLVFSTKRADLEKNSYGTALWLWQKDRLRRLRPPAGTMGHWWWDENSLLLAASGWAEKNLTEKGLPAVAFKVMPLTAGEKARPLFTLYADLLDAFPLPQEKVLLHLWWDPHVEAALAQAEGAPARAAELLAQREGCTVWTRLPFWQEGEGFLQDRCRRLYLWDGAALRPLTDKTLDVEQAVLAPDGQTAWLVANAAEAVSPCTHGLYKLDIATGEVRDCTFKYLRLDDVLPLDGGGLLVVGSTMAAHGLNQNPDFYRLDAAGEAQLLNGTGRHSAWPSVVGDLGDLGDSSWHAKGSCAYFISTQEDSSHLMQLNLTTGDIDKISRQSGALREAVPAQDGWFVVAQREQQPPEVYHLANSGKETRLTQFNDVSAVELAETVPLAAATEKGEVRGWVLLPPDLSGNKEEKIPGLLYIHGGPKMVYGSVLYHEMQYLAAQGWAVMLCNPPGSDGRGDAFADIRGDYGGRDCRQLLAFVDRALEAHPQIDPQRLGVLGGSYGGFAVNWLIGHTRRFAAAVSQRSIASWASMALLSDIGPLFVPDQAGKGSWESALQEDRSPLAHARQVQTPTLFIQGEQDCRCPLSEGAQMYAALKLCGVPTRLVVFHGEGHDIATSGRPQNRLRRLVEIQNWLHLYLDAPKTSGETENQTAPPQ